MPQLLKAFGTQMTPTWADKHPPKLMISQPTDSRPGILSWRVSHALLLPQGLTALQIALQLGHEAVAEALADAGEEEEEATAVAA